MSIVAFLSSAIGFSAESETGNEGQTFDQYLAHWSKKYEVEEYQTRKSLFDTAKATVIAHNKEYRTGTHSWYMALTEYADSTPSEVLVPQPSALMRSSMN